MLLHTQYFGVAFADCEVPEKYQIYCYLSEYFLAQLSLMLAIKNETMRNTIDA